MGKLRTRRRAKAVGYVSLGVAAAASAAMFIRGLTTPNTVLAIDGPANGMFRVPRADIERVRAIDARAAARAAEPDPKDVMQTVLDQIPTAVISRRSQSSALEHAHAMRALLESVPSIQGEMNQPHLTVLPPLSHPLPPFPRK